MARNLGRAVSGMAALLLAAQALPAVPVSAEEEYLVRDKWGYYTSANHMESEHFIIYYGNNDTTGQVNEAFLKRNLEDYEKLWKCYGEYLGMENMNVDIYGRSSQKYKTCVYLTYTGLDQYPDGWAFMSAEDGYGIEIISPNAMLDDLTIAHEFGHVVTMQQKAWVDQDITGAWWEPLANWFREMYLYSDYYTGNVKTCWFEPYIRNLSLTLPHGRNYYEVFPFLVYMSYNPDNLGTLGLDSVKRMISEANPNEYPLDTISRLFGVDAQELLGHYAKRMATFAFGPQAAYQSEFNKKLSESPYYWNLFYTVLDDLGGGKYRVPEEEAPMQTGINIVPLSITGDSITVSFKGLSDDANAGWRAAIVTVDASGKETYSDLFGDGDTVTLSASGAQSAYLTVAGTPKEIYPINCFDKDNKSSYKNSQSRRRYPYEITLTGAAVQQSGGYSAGNGHAHSNGGGFVANGASVADSVYVGPNAKVLGSAKLSGNVRVEDYATVAGSTVATDNVIISGHAVVDGGGMVYDNGWKFGSVTLSDNVVISDGAVVANSCTISGNAKVLGKAYVTESVKLRENAVAKGTAYIYGTGDYSGQIILEGDYANGETLSGGGTAYGWLDTAGTKYDDGMIAGYDFAKERSVWAQDKYAAMDAYLDGAEWASERTSASGVVSLDGTDDSISLDPSTVRTNNLQISLAALWKGGAAQQDLLWIGDENAYISLTPQNADGVAELTLTDGTKTEKLTANSPLTKGAWSKITVRIIDGVGTLLINGQTAAEGALSLTPAAILGASEHDGAYIGKSLAHGSFKGAVDYVNLYFKAVNEPDVTYTGTEDADDTDPAGGTTTTEPQQTGKTYIGDVDCNDEIELPDAVMLAKVNAGLEDTGVTIQGIHNSDCNLNGSTGEPDDLTQLLKFLAGIIAEF